tara:strand:- start:89 stop:271 length:183 start_codon:yes stop_codon:yes gene_type:complete
MEPKNPIIDAKIAASTPRPITDRISFERPSDWNALRRRAWLWVIAGTIVFWVAAILAALS